MFRRSRGQGRSWEDTCNRFERATTVEERKRIADETVLELEVHAHVEEEPFYPAVREAGHLDLMMNAAEEEHYAAKLLAPEVARITPNNPYFEAKYHVLKEMVLHHMREGESDILPWAEALGPEHLSRIWAEIERRRPGYQE